jgi:cytochrome d ubiquinol oxidase subunit I
MLGESLKLYWDISNLSLDQLSGKNHKLTIVSKCPPIPLFRPTCSEKKGALFLLDVSTIVTFDRFLFAFTIASHIILVSMSIALIIVISIAEFISLRRNDRYYRALSRRLSKVFVIFFGVGTASGVVMAVELVTLFPTFMTLVSQTGAILILYAEIFAFFLETISLVMYIYYANYFSKYAHWVLSIFIAAGALLSAVFITMLNAWMNTPNGFDTAVFIQSGTITGIDPWAPFVTASTFSEIAHVLPTVLFAGVMLVGGYFAWWHIKSTDLEEKKMLTKGLKIAAALGIGMIFLAIITGINEITTLLQLQPLKYSAIELNPTPGTDLPEKLFGTLVNGQFYGGIVIPHLQSFLVQIETGITSLPGLSKFPSSTWPPLYVHITFDTMVIGGFALGLFFLAYFVDWAFLKRKPYESKLFLYSWVPLAFVALIIMELGWMTDEVGRQPWIVYNVMTTHQAANYSGGFLVPGILIIAFYVILLPLTFYFFSRVFNSSSMSEEEEKKQEGETGTGVSY